MPDHVISPSDRAAAEACYRENVLRHISPSHPLTAESMKDFLARHFAAHAASAVEAANKENENLRRLLKESYDRFLWDDDGDPQEHDVACYCTDTGAGEWIDGKLVGDLLMCLPCKIRAALTPQAQEPNDDPR